ncbi:MAG: hypothetical protein ABIU76_02875, partial [Gemmatimonadaceae bacterium]
MKVTLCTAPENRHVTLSLMEIVMDLGRKLVPGVVTTFDPGGGLTSRAVMVTTQVPVWVTPPTVSVAVIVAVPGATPVTNPVASTLARLGSLDVNAASGNPLIDEPDSSFGVAVS